MNMLAADLRVVNMRKLAHPVSTISYARSLLMMPDEGRWRGMEAVEEALLPLHEDYACH